MNKTIDIEKLKHDIIAECARGHVVIPVEYINKIVVLHRSASPDYSELRFAIKHWIKRYDVTIKVDKIIGGTLICCVGQSDPAPVVNTIVEHHFI